MTAPSVQRRRTTARFRALLAGGLVLGIGGTVTLAAWTDMERASGTFAASRFSIEANVSDPYSVSGPWTVNEAGPGAALAFSAAGMFPKATNYAPIALRTQAGSIGGIVVLLPPEITDSPGTDPRLSSALLYRVILSETCTAAAFTADARYVVGSSAAPAPLTVGQNPETPTLLAPAGETTPGVSTNFCFQVTLPDGADSRLQGASATAVWRFSAESAQ